LEEEGLQGNIFGALLEAAGDPEKEVPEWLSTFAPLGIETQLHPSGVFPEIAEQGIGSAASQNYECVVLESGEPWANYTSYEENKELADKEIERELQEGYLVWRSTREELEELIGALVPAKIGVIVKIKADGSIKIRLIHDMKRSGTNGRIRVRERLVLPRIADIIESLKALLRSRRPHEVLQMLATDFKDAFKQIKTDPKEQRYLSGQALGGWFYYTRMFFGVGSGPLVWGRTAAATGRIVQSAHDRAKLQHHSFVDDPLAVARGKPAEVKEAFVGLLLLWSALGLKVAYNKISVGTSVEWIGALIQVVAEENKIVITLPARKFAELVERIEEIAATAQSGQARADLVRRLAGLGSLLSATKAGKREFFGEAV
jgi:hypothetical protein